MDEFVFAIEGEGPRREWWIGDGLWWLLVEGFGLVEVSNAFSTEFSTILKERSE